MFVDNVFGREATSTFGAPPSFHRILEWIDYHPYDRYVTVISGTWWVGTGTDYEMSKAVPMKAGSFVKHTAGGIHFDGAKEEEVVLQIVGMGPASSVAAQAKSCT